MLQKVNYLIPIYIRALSFSSTSTMALSRFEYVKKFERSHELLRGCWIVVRLDGKGFHKFSDKHNFIKPNDKRCLDLMSQCAKVVMKEFHEVFMAYGQSDEYSFVLRKNTNLYSRRSSKINTNIVSLFASSFVFIPWALFVGLSFLKTKRWTNINSREHQQMPPPVQRISDVFVSIVLREQATTVWRLIKKKQSNRHSCMLPPSF